MPLYCRKLSYWNVVLGPVFWFVKVEMDSIWWDFFFNDEGKLILLVGQWFRVGCV